MKQGLVIAAALLLAATLFAEEIDTGELFRSIEEQWDGLSDYTCVVETFTKKGEKEQLSTLHSKFLTPKWIRMQVIEGDGKGSIGVYNPITKKVRGCKTGILKIIVLTLELSDERVSSIRGLRIDQGDCLSLIGRLRDYRAREELSSIEKTTYGDRPAYLFKAEVQDSSRLWGAQEERIWLDAENSFPLRVEHRLGDGTVVHHATYRDIKINTGLTTEDFKL